jgi:hypothetical protein
MMRNLIERGTGTGDPVDRMVCHAGSQFIRLPDINRGKAARLVLIANQEVDATTAELLSLASRGEVRAGAVNTDPTPIIFLHHPNPAGFPSADG